MNIGDVVIADKLVQHDFDITAFGHKKGYISDVGDVFICEGKLVNKCKEKMTQVAKGEEFKVEIGTIASGDIFCTSTKMKNKIREKFDAICVEMEGAAIAQVCYLDKVPFIVIRSISDSPNENNNIEFDKFLGLASKRCALFIEKMI